MGGSCGTYGGLDGCIQGDGGGNLRERDHLEDLGMDVEIILILFWKM